MTRDGLMAQYGCVHCPIWKVQGSIKTQVLKKSGQNMSFIRAVHYPISRP